MAPPGSELARKLARWPNGLPAEALRALRADYADHLALLDAQVGELLAALAQRPDVPQTALSVCSAHGELLGDWGLLLKGCFLEEGRAACSCIESPYSQLLGVGFDLPAQGPMDSRSCSGARRPVCAIRGAAVSDLESGGCRGMCWSNLQRSGWWFGDPSLPLPSGGGVV